MKMKITKKILSAALLIALGGIAFSQQLTTVGIIDTARVYSAYFGQSGPIREREALRNQFQQELERHSRELLQLQQNKLAAQERGNESEVIRIEGQINQKASFIRDLQRTRQQQLDDMQNNLALSDAFLQRLQDTLRLVAESRGFTVVLDARNQALQWWSSEVDITEDVIRRLRN